jgi:hypothetical protein
MVCGGDGGVGAMTYCGGGLETTIGGLLALQAVSAIRGNNIRAFIWVAPWVYVA